MQEKDNQKYGYLLQDSATLHRQYFREMVKLLGIWVLYRAPKQGKTYTTYAEIDTNYEPPKKIGVIFDQHPQQQTLRKMGWASELQDQASIIHVDYDLPGLQQGALFIIPSGLDDGQARLFRVVRLQTSMVYPASIACEIIPEYENTFNPVEKYDYQNSSFNLLHRDDEEEDYVGNSI